MHEKFVLLLMLLNMNSSSTKISTFILKVAFYGFLAAAIYHLFALFIVLNNSTGWRNFLFAFINLWCAYEIKGVKNYFVILFSVLFIQQFISHGQSILKSIGTQMDWLSIFVLAALAIVYFALLVVARFKVISSKAS